MPKREIDSPRFHGAVVVIDTDTVDRAKRTGHPRLLRNLLEGKQEFVFQSVQIARLTIDGTLQEKRQ